MSSSEEVKCTHSTVLSKDGKPFVSVLFERGEAKAEGLVPDCTIVKSNGFSSEEIEQLETYLREHRKEIIEGAKKISSFKHWFK